MKKEFKYTGIYNNDSYTFESENWILDIDVVLKYDQLGNLSITGHCEANEKQSYSFCYDGIDFRIFCWNSNLVNHNGLHGTTGRELNVFKYLPKYVRKQIQVAYVKLSQDNTYFIKLNSILKKSKF